MITKESFDNVSSLLKESDKAQEALLKVAQLAGSLYKNESDDFIREIYKALNKVYCDAGKSIAAVETIVCSSQIKILDNTIEALKEQEQINK